MLAFSFLPLLFDNYTICNSMICISSLQYEYKRETLARILLLSFPNCTICNSIYRIYIQEIIYIYIYASAPHFPSFFPNYIQYNL